MDSLKWSMAPSINKNALVDNMEMETVVAQRKVNDYMRNNNFQPHNMPMSKTSLLDAKQKQEHKKSIGAIKIEKQIAGLNAWKNQLKITIEEYKKEGGKYAFEVENKGNLELLKLSNSLKHACKEKQEELDEFLKKKQ